MATNLNDLDFSSGLDIDWEAVVADDLAAQEAETQAWLNSFMDSGKETPVTKKAPVTEPSWIDVAVKFIKEREGFRSEVYSDPLKPGLMTVGHGRTANNISGRPIEAEVTEAKADANLREDIIATEQMLREIIDPKIYDSLNIYNKAALISLVDNVGVPDYKGSNALEFLNQGDINNSLIEMFDPDKGWTKVTQDGKKVKVPGLVNRRDLELKLWNTPLETASEIRSEVKDSREQLKLTPKAKAILQDDADSWSNQLAIGTDNMLSSINNGLSVFSRMAGLDDQAEEFEQASKDYEKSALSRPKPSREPIATKEYKRITEKFSDNQVLEGMAEIAKQAKTYTSTAVPFLIPSVATLAGVKAAAPLLRAIPVIGPPISIISQVVIPLLPGFVMGGGEIYKEAKKEGATDEKAESAALGGGAIVGLLDRFGASVIVNSWIKAFGKDRVAKVVASQVGEKAAEKAIKKASKLGVTSVLSSALKGAFKSGTAETFTEGLQEVVISESAAKAAGVEPKNQGERIINAAVLGWFGGAAPGTVSGAMSPLMRKEVANRIEEFKESDAELGRSVVDQDKELELMDYNDINLKSSTPRGLRRSLSFVKSALGETEVGRQLFNRMNSFYFNTNVEAGNLMRRVENEVVAGVLKDTKLPFAKRVKKKISNAVGRRLRGYDIDTSKFSNEEVQAIENAKDNARKILGEVDQDGNPTDSKSIYGLLKEAGVELGFVENYLRNTYKIPMIGFGKRKAKKEFLKVLKENSATRDFAEEILDNILSNNNVYTGDQSVNLFPDTSEGPTLPVGKRGFEMPRTLPPEVVKKLDDAGLVENNFEGIMKALAIAAPRRAEAQRIFNDFNTRKNELGLDRGETKRIKDVYQAIQGNYKPIESYKGQKVNQFLATAGYVTTLPLAVIISLSEPLIVLSRVSPKNALWGLIKASRVGLSKAVRTIRPKHKISDLENAFNGLLQTADLASQNAIRDLDNASVNKRITDRFFRINLLAQFTQFSRQIGFAAINKQLQEDLIKIETEQQTGTTPTLETTRARKRLREQGLSNLLGKRKGKIPSLSVEPKIKGYTAAMSEAIGFGLKKGETFISKKELKTIRSKINKKDINEYKKARKKYDNEKQKISRLRKGDRELSEVEVAALEWARGNSEPPVIIQRAIGKTVDEVIMSPNAVNRPLWMSNPHFALAAQLKGFMVVFGNTVGYKLWKEVFQPLSPVHRTREGVKFGMPQVNPEATFRYALMFTVLLGAMYGTQIMKDVIRYDDPDDSPIQDLEGWELMLYLLRRSNIFGYGNIFIDAAESSKYGTSQIASLAGPVAVKLEQLANAMTAFGDGRPRQLASWMAKNTPFVGALGTDRLSEVPVFGTDDLEELLEPLSESIRDFRE